MLLEEHYIKYTFPPPQVFEKLFSDVDRVEELEACGEVDTGVGEDVAEEGVAVDDKGGGTGVVANKVDAEGVACVVPFQDLPMGVFGGHGCWELLQRWNRTRRVSIGIRTKKGSLQFCR
jgi:hypothetical protein